MKKRIALVLASLLLAVMGLSLFGQQDSTVYKLKIDRYQSWQRTGKIIIITGAAVEAIGMGLLVRAFTMPENVSDDSAFLAAYSIMGAGVGIMIPGVIFHGIGKRKTSEYKIRLEDARMGLYMSPQYSGFTFTYRF